MHPLLLTIACSLSRADLDGDGFTAPEDCDDRDHTVYPGAEEIWYDGADQDCDGNDEDADGDGAPYTEDCDDVDADVADPSGSFVDADGDGHGGAGASSCDDAATVHGGDCDDADGDVNPDMVEVCENGRDDDCDGTAAGCDLTGSWTEANADVAVEGGDRVGWTLAYGADLGEGPGLVTGGPRSGTPGVVVVMTGEWRDGTPATARFVPDGGTTGHEAWSEVGYTVAAVPGSRVLAGGPYANFGAGRAWLLTGPFTADLGEGDATAVVEGDAGDQLGAAVASAGDPDGDGAADVLVGATGDEMCERDRPKGRAWMFPASISGTVLTSDATAWFTGETCGDAAGNALASLGDVDGDGVDDVGVAAVNHDSGGLDAGAVYVVLGPVSGGVDLGDADARIVGEEGSKTTSDYFGTAVAGAGDVDGDGLADLVVGAPQVDQEGADGSGAFYVFVAPLEVDDAQDAEAKVLGAGAEHYLGSAVAGGGDVDGDGLADVIGGAYAAAGKAGGNTGMALLLLGPPAGVVAAEEADGWFEGSRALIRLGASVALGDLDGDGYADVALGADHGATGMDNEPGWIYAFFGGGR